MLFIKQIVEINKQKGPEHYASEYIFEGILPHYEHLQTLKSENTESLLKKFIMMKLL